MPSDEGDDSAMWREYRAAQQARRAERLPRRTDEIMDLEAAGYKVEKKTDYQYRIDRKIDIYPIHRRAHFLGSGRRCTYPAGGLKTFIEKGDSESMKGNNEITLNQQTMVAAIQHYFETVVFAPGKVPEVKSVEFKADKSRDCYSPSVGDFTVKVSEKIEA